MLAFDAISVQFLLMIQHEARAKFLFSTILLNSLQDWA